MTNFAFIFPGQGSQTIGMLDGFKNNLLVQQTIEEASDILDTDFNTLISTGPKEALDLTTNTQPVMLTVAVACYRAWINAGGEPPSVVAGHSLGEYSALVASGVIAFRDALPLVRFRAQAMQDAVPVGVGGMAAIIGLSDEVVQEVCLEAAQSNVVEAVNFNAPSQVVIAGHMNAVLRACELAKTRGAKRALMLPVSAPFHSSLLKNASLKLESYLSAIRFEEPLIPVINNVAVMIENDPVRIKAALVNQAARPVRWVETIRKIAADGIEDVIECGPGKVLTGLVKRIEPTLIAGAVYDQNTLNETLRKFEK